MIRVGGVLLASGAGSRFGGEKLLYEVEGVPMIRRAFAALPAALFDRAAVAAVRPDILTMAAERGYLPLRNSEAGEGQSASVRLGLSRMLELDGVLFAVCDQPWLRRRSVERLLADFRSCPDRIWALSWQGERGNPAVFPAALFPRLMALSGDCGGGRVIRANRGLLRMTEAEGPEELRDVDARPDLLGRK